ncbi:SigE family RNA polymerase sigma factor [Nocardioides sp.]|uniref:SigE family RNA polymerase sigma factor n=1 Tax=Nocardioides sp. TaxID=35761 RepID=UPI00352786DD
MSVDEEFTDFATARTADLFRCALLLTGDWHAAEDLVQDTWAQVYRRWNRVSAAEQPGAYARRMLVNAFLSRSRRRSSTELSVADPGRDQPAAAPDVALRATLFEALARLAPRDRVVVVLRYWDGLDAASTGELLGCSPDAVRTRARRALARLREELATDLPSLLTD